MNIQTETGIRFNSTNFPSFTPTDITDVAVDSNGNIFIACRATGLYKISNPTGSPSITVIDDSTTGLTGAAGPQVYGVAAGRNDRMWIIMSGGLFYSDNGGTSWSTATFSFTGISDANWDKVRSIEADIQDANDNIGIVYFAAGILTVCWYTFSTSLI